jgi:hypothetical protein
LFDLLLQQICSLSSGYGALGMGHWALLLSPCPPCPPCPLTPVALIGLIIQIGLLWLLYPDVRSTQPCQQLAAGKHRIYKPLFNKT